jgi:hypothetical protein
MKDFEFFYCLKIGPPGAISQFKYALYNTLNLGLTEAKTAIDAQRASIVELFP